MPGRDGLRLISALKQVDPEAEIVAVSGKSKGMLQASTMYGARAILEKPVDRDALIAAVEDIIGR